MSRRRKEKEEGPKGFDFPEFDEREFIRKETISFRSALVLLAWSVFTAFVTFLVWLMVPDETTGWYAGLVVAAGLGYMLRWILPASKVDIEHFGKKEWFGTGALFFFSWLAFFILILNPPIYDGVEPELELHVTPRAQDAGGPVNVTLIATDNVAVDTTSVAFQVIGPDGNPRADTQDLWAAVEDGVGVWSWGFTPEEPGTYRVEASVQGTAGGSLIGGGRTATMQQEFQVGDVVEVIMSGMNDQGVGRLTNSRDAVTVYLPGEMDVYRAWLENTRPDNSTVPVFLEHDEERSTPERQEWFAQPGFNGFAQGENRFQVHVEEHNTYFLELRYETLGPMTAPLVTNQTYTVEIPDAALLGDRTPDLPDERDPTVQRVPGPAPLLGVLAALGVLAWIRRRRPQHDQSARLSGA